MVGKECVQCKVKRKTLVWSSSNKTSKKLWRDQFVYSLGIRQLSCGSGFNYIATSDLHITKFVTVHKTAERKCQWIHLVQPFTIWRTDVSAPRNVKDLSEECYSWRIEKARDRTDGGLNNVCSRQCLPAWIRLSPLLHKQQVVRGHKEIIERLSQSPCQAWRGKLIRKFNGKGG